MAVLVIGQKVTSTRLINDKFVENLKTILMINFIYEGGALFMVPLLITLIVIVALIIKGFIKEDSDTNRALISSLSLFSLVFGILGTTIGLMGAFEAIAIANNISMGVLAVGLRVGLITTSFGLSIFVIGRLGIIALLLKKK